MIEEQQSLKKGKKRKDKLNIAKQSTKISIPDLTWEHFSTHSAH